MPLPALTHQFISTRRWLSSNRWQALAFLFCVIFGAAMIVNVGFSGEASWFWYATLMHRGVRLYADMHMPLQPFYPLEVEGWMILVGKRLLPYETLALIHVVLLCLGMLLILRESDWPDWRKAVIFSAAFFTDLHFSAIRFDDFHVVNDAFVLFSIVVALRILRSEDVRRELMWSGLAGVLSGLAFTNRSTDGATLLAAVAFGVPFLARRNKLVATACFLLMAALSIVAIVHLTGDNFHDYLANSIFHAAAAKGGTGTVLHGPYRALVDNWDRMLHSRSRRWFIGIVAVVFLTLRFRKDDAYSIITAELALSAFAFCILAILPTREVLWTDSLIEALNLPIQNALYPLCLLVFLHYVLAKFFHHHWKWDPREVLILVPTGMLVSAAASQADGSFNSTISMVIVLLLVPWWIPADGRYRWMSDTSVVIALLITATGMAHKIVTPYSWGAYSYQPMFRDREWYNHPVYGPMYLNPTTLQFILPICKDVHESNRQPELLSLPYSYANYFCDIAPWHNYVQTWFDTATPATIDNLMQQLNQAPPEWILYQRQLRMLRLHELEYNGGRPMMHRRLDEMIMAHIASGQWKLIRHDDYLKGDGWYLIQTHP